MEQAPSAELFGNPLNSYTPACSNRFPGADGIAHRLRAYRGTIPNAPIRRRMPVYPRCRW